MADVLGAGAEDAQHALDLLALLLALRTRRRAAGSRSCAHPAGAARSRRAGARARATGTDLGHVEPLAHGLQLRQLLQDVRHAAAVSSGSCLCVAVRGPAPCHHPRGCPGRASATRRCRRRQHLLSAETHWLARALEGSWKIFYDELSSPTQQIRGARLRAAGGAKWRADPVHWLPSGRLCSTRASPVSPRAPRPRPRGDAPIPARAVGVPCLRREMLESARSGGLTPRGGDGGGGGGGGSVPTTAPTPTSTRLRSAGSDRKVSGVGRRAQIPLEAAAASANLGSRARRTCTGAGRAAQGRSQAARQEAAGGGGSTCLTVSTGEDPTVTSRQGAEGARCVPGVVSQVQKLTEWLASLPVMAELNEQAIADIAPRLCERAQAKAVSML